MDPVSTRQGNVLRGLVATGPWRQAGLEGKASVPEEAPYAPRKQPPVPSLRTRLSRELGTNF